METSLTLEQTNRLRISLGLRPIPVPSKCAGNQLNKERLERLQAKLNEREPGKEREREPGKEQQQQQQETRKRKSTMDWLSGFKTEPVGPKVEPVESKVEPPESNIFNVESEEKVSRASNIEPEQASKASNIEPEQASKASNVEPKQSSKASNVEPEQSSNVEPGKASASKPSKPEPKALQPPVESFDPLDFDASFDVKKTVQSDFLEPKHKKIKFKKRKTSVKSARSYDEEVRLPPTTTHEDEPEIPRATESRVLTPKDVAELVKADPVDASTTTAFLEKLRDIGKGRKVHETAKESKPGDIPELDVPNEPESNNPDSTEPEPADEPMESSNPETNKPQEQNNPESNEPTEPGESNPQESMADEPDEPTELISHGLGATLRLLKARTVVPDTQPSRRINRDWARRITEKRLVRQHELDLQKNVLDKIPANQRQAALEAQQELEQKEEARFAAEQFKDYSPVVEIVHKDTHGRVLDQKEAYKELSRVFHGTKQGKKSASRQKNKHGEVQAKVERNLF